MKESDLQSLQIGDLYDNIISGLSGQLSTNTELSVIKFAEQVLFNGELNLFETQKALLKSFYGEKLSAIEAEIMKEWIEANRSSYKENRKYKSLIIECGRGAGKSTLAAIIALYEFYKLISLPDPAKHYGFAPNDPIHIFVIARSLEQVKKTLFSKVAGYARQSKVFQALQAKKEIDIQTLAIRCPAKNVEIVAQHTNSPALVGYTLKCIILDEVARFDNILQDDGSISSLADEMFDNVGAGTNRFSLEGKKVAISSAWAENDPIERFVERSKKDSHSIFFSLRTWDLNLNEAVQRKNLESDYNNDYAKAQLEFENIRTKRVNGFISEAQIEKSITGNSVIDVTPYDFTYGEGETRREYTGLNIDRLERNKNFDSFIHIDLSLSGDSTALGLVHFDPSNKKICVDGILKWTPERDKKGNKKVVSYVNVEEVLMEIIEQRNIVKVSFDSWNSESTIQRLNLKGIFSEKISSSRTKQLEYYKLFKSLLSQNSIQLPQDCPNTYQLQNELTHLILKSNGSIQHGVEGKDLSDAVVNAIYQCHKSLDHLSSNNQISDSVDILSSNSMAGLNNKLNIGPNSYYRKKLRKIVTNSKRYRR